TAYQFKRHAIQSSLYGVDIDSGAVEIAKLRLWLSLVVDEVENQHIKPLPNLDFKIVSGDSLLGFRFASHGLADIEQLKAKYFDEPDHSKKAELKKQIDEYIKSILSQTKQALGYNVGFDFRLFFSEVFHDRGGFDVVIGNPPYGIIFNDELKSHLTGIYKSFRQNNDTYTAFIEKGVSLLKERGQFSFITPNTYLNGDYFTAVRSMLSSDTRIREISDFRNVHVFDDPTVFVAVVIASRVSPEYPYDVALRTASSIDRFTFSAFTMFGESNAPLKEQNAILERLRHDSRFVEIDELFLVKDVGFNYWTTGRGKKRGENSIGDRVLYSGTRRHRQDIPFLKGRDISRWNIRKASNYLRHDYVDFLDPTKDTFRFSEGLLKMAPKVVYRQTSASIVAAIDGESRYLDKTVHMVVPRTGWGSCEISPGLLAGLLNSDLFDYLYRYISQESEGRAFAQVKTTYIKKLPVPIRADRHTHAIERIAMQLNGQESPTNLARLEEDLNDAVYALYEVTPDELSRVRAVLEQTVAMPAEVAE
ncbi:MAG: Eco57I restriction-modification methylase domain-containing protein, partial [Nitrososphaerota archaeon]|nr:Eco57I restriction-modification methylase domain-containing protein [Nitrososphaerota archaeon]